MCFCIAETLCTNKKAEKKNTKAIKAKESITKAKKAKESITEKDKRLLDWEKVNALQYVQKDRIAQKEELNSRVVVIEDRCV